MRVFERDRVSLGLRAVAAISFGVLLLLWSWLTLSGVHLSLRRSRCHTTRSSGRVARRSWQPSLCAGKGLRQSGVS
jgi:hypothetical protein